MAKILLVEDDNNLREIYEARLQAEGYTIVAAQDGEEALVVAKKEKPDLIISDVMMPRISGFEMLDILRNTDGLKDVKVIMLTALGQAEDKTRADSLGADRYLVKSQVTLEDIVKAAQELLGGGGTPAPGAPAGGTTPPAGPSGPAPILPAPATPASTAPAAASPSPPPTPAPTSPAPTPPVTPAPPTPTEPPKPQIAAPAPAAPPAVAAPPAPAIPTPPAPTPEPPAAQSTSEEEAAIKSQIENFVNQNSQTAPKPVGTPAAAPAPAPTSAEPSEENIMADAIKDLVSGTDATPAAPAPSTPKVVEPPTTSAPAPTTFSPTPTPAPASAAGVPAPAATPTITPPPATDDDKPTLATPAEDDSSTGVHKKIIKPITDMKETAPNLDELMAKEGFTNLDSENAPAGPVSAASVVSPGNVPPPAPASAVSGGLPTTPHPPGHVISPNATSGVDPNSIAL